jgi:hypothetical protein
MKWTISKAAKEFATTEETITRGLRYLGLDTKRKSKGANEYTTKQIVGAIFGDLKHEKTRLTRAEAEIKEIESLEKANTVIPRDDVVTFIRETFSPVREMVIALAGSQAALCNPSDPQHAHAHLTAWTDMFLKHCKERMPVSAEKETKE